ncbi:hypothetical protein BKA70DRAFT_1231100 [Coprinopsis sp. MPI-PUGE-AT-0042]|nr:hypothetical protein BKA70DRAFT_1231100 [Coprinopsis sp. MPI-PUGE-AT-0042]
MPFRVRKKLALTLRIDHTTQAHHTATPTRWGHIQSAPHSDTALRCVSLVMEGEKRREEEEGGFAGGGFDFVCSEIQWSSTRVGASAIRLALGTISGGANVAFAKLSLGGVPSTCPSSPSSRSRPSTASWHKLPLKYQPSSRDWLNPKQERGQRWCTGGERRVYELWKRSQACFSRGGCDAGDLVELKQSSSCSHLVGPMITDIAFLRSNLYNNIRLLPRFKVQNRPKAFKSPGEWPKQISLPPSQTKSTSNRQHSPQAPTATNSLRRTTSRVTSVDFQFQCRPAHLTHSNLCFNLWIALRMDGEKRKGGERPDPRNHELESRTHPRTAKRKHTELEARWRKTNVACKPKTTCCDLATPLLYTSFGWRCTEITGITTRIRKANEMFATALDSTQPKVRRFRKVAGAAEEDDAFRRKVAWRPLDLSSLLPSLHPTPNDNAPHSPPLPPTRVRQQAHGTNPHRWQILSGSSFWQVKRRPSFRNLSNPKRQRSTVMHRRRMASL